MYALLKDTRGMCMLSESPRIYLYYKLQISHDDDY